MKIIIIMHVTKEKIMNRGLVISFSTNLSSHKAEYLVRVTIIMNNLKVFENHNKKIKNEPKVWGNIFQIKGKMSI